MSEARPPGSRLARADSRPILVSALVVGWLLLSGFGALRAIVVLGNLAATSTFGDTDPLARAAAAAPDLVTDETRQLLAQRQERRSLERNLAGPLLLVATLGVVGAIGLLRRRLWSRVVLLSVGVLAIGLSAFHSTRSIGITAAPAAGLVESDPDARNALALVRSAAAIGLALQSIPLILAMSLLRHPIVRDYVSVPGARRPRSGRRPDTLLVVAGAAVLIAAGAVTFSRNRAKTPPPEKGVSEAPAPEPSETFRWSDQPIAFSAPAGPWTRERHAEGGRKGVSFTRYQAPPSRIIVAEASLETAPATADEILPRFRLTREQFRSADSVTVGEPVRAVVAGYPAFQTDYSLRERSMQHRGREFYTVVAGHAFVFTFLGRETDLPVLENLVASVRFPAGADGDAPRTTFEDIPPDEKSGGEVTELRVGEQRVTVRVPRQWEHIDYGQRQEFRHREARILLVDGGPVEAAGTATEIDDKRVIERALRFFDHDPRRWEVSSKTRMRVGSREALAVDTWEPLSHVFHKRTVLFVNAGRLLVAGTAQGTVEETKGPLDELVRSIRFPDS
ncbi:MAG: hypothetical protein NEA02_09255 [Thermoanaerobaculia bacterium]|nr:hypothetical protein [Thermoanaerobaculia bacterium]